MDSFVWRCEVDADLHRTTDAHRIEVAEQLTAQGRHADKVVKQFA